MVPSAVCLNAECGMIYIGQLGYTCMYCICLVAVQFVCRWELGEGASCGSTYQCVLYSRAIYILGILTYIMSIKYIYTIF